MTTEELKVKQQEIEADMHGAGIDRFYRNAERSLSADQGSETAWFRRLTREFIEPTSDAIQAYLDFYEGKQGKPSRSLYYLRMLPTEVSAYVALKVMFDYLPQTGTSIQNVCEKIGKRIEDQVRFTKIEEAAPKYVKAIQEGIAKSHTQKYQHKRRSLITGEQALADDNVIRRLHSVGMQAQDICDKLQFPMKKVESAIAHPEDSGIKRWQDWPKLDVVQLGARLLDIIHDNVKHEGNQIIKKVTRNIGIGKRKTVCYLEPTENIVDWIEEYQDVIGQLSPCYAPCVIPPRPWKTPTNGGFHSVEVASTCRLVKTNDLAHLKRLTRKQMPIVYKAVNSLQNVEWRVNQDILETMKSVVESGNPIGMPQRDPIFKPECPVPEEYKDLRGQDLKNVIGETGWNEFTEWKRDIAASYDLERERKSRYTAAHRTFQQAILYKDLPIYFVYTLDSRGRIYSQSSLLSPQGSDIQKGLIHFGKEKELGETGKKWLAIHGANCWGEDKEIFAKRMKWVRDHHEDILDYADNPRAFTGWAGADKPWQFLAFCFEWARLAKWEAEGNSVTQFLSSIPIAQDGSCSGIQHYSAMLRDPVGGRSVNLMPTSKPQDIYADVADIVRDKMTRISKGERMLPAFPLHSQMDLSEAWLEVGVTRSMTKKPVMTLPYGSTQLTCSKSIGDYLDDLQSTEDKKAKASERSANRVHPFRMHDDDMNRFDAIRLASKLTWDSIGDVVVAARAGMKCLRQVAKAMSDRNEFLQWTTPTGFIVKQDIKQTKRQRVNTQLMGNTMFSLLIPTNKIDPDKMKGAAAPNFIHSYDASHLVMVSSSCDDLDITLAVVHDSFATHACDVDDMRNILREELVALYDGKDVLDEFVREQEDRIMQTLNVKVPEMGTMKLESILKSKYTFA